MNSKFAIMLTALSFTLAVPGAAIAGPHGGGHVATSGHVTSMAVFRGSPVAGGGRVIHSRPYFGSRVFYGRSFYRPGFFYPRHRFYGGLAFGLFVASLPFYYDTIWWGGIPYYYADGTYYVYNDNVRKYEVVPPPYSDEAAERDQAAAGELFVYPKEGQSEEKINADRFECHQWAVDKTGVDPSKGAPTDKSKLADYRRAESACLSGRGYSVK